MGINFASLSRFLVIGYLCDCLVGIALDEPVRRTRADTVAESIKRIAKSSRIVVEGREEYGRWKAEEIYDKEIPHTIRFCLYVHKERAVDVVDLCYFSSAPGG